jgi:ankyrin repeat protein
MKKNITLKGSSALHLAVLGGSLPVVATLLHTVGNVNATNNNSETPLHWSVGKGDPECVKILLQAGASVNVSDLGKISGY